MPSRACRRSDDTASGGKRNSAVGEQDRSRPLLSSRTVSVPDSPADSCRAFRREVARDHREVGEAHGLDAKLVRMPLLPIFDDVVELCARIRVHDLGR